MKITGLYCPKVFCVCATKDEFSAVYAKLAQENSAGLNDVEGYELPGSGVIVYLAQTLMTWGHVRIKRNGRTQRNGLRDLGYIQITPEEVVCHDGPITGGTRK